MEVNQRIHRLKAPFYVQFEITDGCNNRCFFCYNEKAKTAGDELSLREICRILDEMNEVGVASVNFNGGEPLVRSDFLEMMEYAYYLGFDLHMNTNATLVTDYSAKRIARCMPSICTSILHSDREIHDKATGRKGAYDDVLNGIKLLIKNGVDVEVNVCTHKGNYNDIYNIGKLASDIGCHALCSTRYILNSSDNLDILMDAKCTEELVDILLTVRDDFRFDTVLLPGPVPFCELSPEYRDKLARLNVPCQYGYGLCRISSTGKVTPCTISDDIVGDLRKSSFEEVWSSEKWKKYRELCHLPPNCSVCSDLNVCRGGCVVYDQSLVACGVDLHTKKWEVGGGNESCFKQYS